MFRHEDTSMKSQNPATGSSKIIREQLLALLEGGNAHMDFKDALSGFPPDAINMRVPNGSYTVWHLLEHMRIAQWDILGFVVNPKHVSPDFPDGYWPPVDRMATVSAWKTTVRQFKSDLKAMSKIVRNRRTDFFGPIPHARDYTILREVLLVADHNSYHLGEFVSIRRILNLKPVKEY